MLPTIFRHWLPYKILAWIAALGAGSIALYYAWHGFDKSDRLDGNSGHATIDFGAQWLMGRMLVSGNGRQLYNRTVQREVLRFAFPDTDCKPGHSDVEELMRCMMGRDDEDVAQAAASFVLPLGAASSLQSIVILVAWPEEQTQQRVRQASTKQIGGPLYPPINALFNSPLALIPPRLAYRLQQVANLLLVFLAGLGLCRLSQGRFWWPIAAGSLMVFPGFAGSIDLGQNATLTLTILVWGWVLAAQGRPGWGGALWGLLAFKPVWALAFLLVPLLSRRWWFGLMMIASGSTLVLLTLPFVGWHSWLDWLRVGQDAALLYNVDQNWITLSRDLLSIPRRWLLDFENATTADRDRNWLPPALLGWSLLLLSLEITVRLAVLRRRQAASSDGPPAAFLLLGAWMSCFHFMYYDVLLAALPVFLLFTEPRRYLEPLLLAIVPLRRGAGDRRIFNYHRAALPGEVPSAPPWFQPAYQHIWVLNRMAPTVAVLLVAAQYLFPYLGLGSYSGPPWDTFFLMGLWLWCGWQWLRHGKKVAVSWS